MNARVSIVPEGIMHDLEGIPNKALVVSSLPDGSYGSYAADKSVDMAIQKATLSEIIVWVLKRDAGTLRLRFTVTHIDTDVSPSAPKTETESAYSDYTIEGNIGDVSPLDVPSALLATFTDIDKGDTLGIGIERDGDASGDTYEADFDIVRVDFWLASGTALTGLRLRPFTKRLRAGTLRHRVTIQEQQLITDGYGGTTQSWGDVAEFWAEISHLSMREVMIARQGGTIVDTRILTRYPGPLSLFGGSFDNISRVLRVKYGDRHFKIEGAFDRGDVVEMLASEEQART